MKLFSTNDQIFTQAQLPFHDNNLNFMAKFFIVSLITVSIILSFPVFGHSSELTERLPMPATEKTASLNMGLDEQNTDSDTSVVKISTNPNGQAINAVGVLINFATSTIIIKDINTSNSFCTLFIVNTIDNQNGQINIICGKPYPGISTEATIAEITFQKLTSSAPDITFASSSMVLANDGFGTDILKTINNLK